MKQIIHSGIITSNIPMDIRMYLNPALYKIL